MKRTILILVSLLFSGLLFSQNKVYLLDGTYTNFESYKIDSENSYFFYTEYDRKNELRTSYYNLVDVFSITYNSKDSIIYYPYSEDEISVEDMKMVVIGKQDALKYHSSLPFMLIGGAVGGGCLFVPVNNLIGLGIPIVYSGSSLLFEPREKSIMKNNPDAIDNSFYIEGYQTAARNKNFKGAVYGSLGGLAVAAIIIGAISIAGN